MVEMGLDWKGGTDLPAGGSQGCCLLKIRLGNCITMLSDMGLSVRIFEKKVLNIKKSYGLKRFKAML